jgi:hypothetical protein
MQSYSGKRVILRGDTQDALGIVSTKYKIVQPIEVLEFFRDMLGSTAQLETAGVLRGGAHYWALAKMEGEFSLAGDKVQQYLLLASSADGSLATQARLTSVRVVCNNTMQIAQRGGQAVKVRHSSIFNPSDVKQKLSQINANFKSFQDTAQYLAKLKLSSQQSRAFFDKILGGSDDKPSRQALRALDLYEGSGIGSTLESASQTNRLAVEDRFGFTLESDEYILNQQDGIGRSFLIQEVSITPVITPNGFMIVSQISCGKYTGSLVDSLSAMQELKSSSPKVSQPIPTRLSNYSSDLGEVVVGRATFTDGGTAHFNWGTPNGASGIVVGLEDKDNAYGALYVYHGGTVKAKLGNLVGMPMIGTITPSGWGLYTENGYFTGVVAASQLIGGTITGNQIIGGTVAGNVVTGGTINGAVITAGSIISNIISGGTVTATQIESATLTSGIITASDISSTLINGNTIYAGTINSANIFGNTLTGNTIIGGTIATGTPPINSSNPGVMLDSSGLYGYGTIGLTFRLSTDPAIAPYFSSGTITNAVYEVTNQSVIRTGLTNPRIQIDNSGIFAYNSAGNLKFSVDTATGNMTANNGTFSGTITTSSFSAGTLSASLLTGGTITGNQITGGTITGNQIIGGTITGNQIIGGTITGNTFTANNITTNDIYSNTLSLNNLYSNNIYSNTIFSNTLNANTVNGGTINGNQINGGTITGVLVQANTLTGNSISGGTITGGLISGGTVSGALLSGGTLSLSEGNLTVTSEGINLYQSGTTNFYSDTNSFYTRLRTNGTVVGYTGLRYQAGLSFNDIVLGKDTSPNVPGNYSVKAFGSPITAFNWTQLDVSGSWGMVFQSNAGKMFEVTAYSVSVGTVSTAYNITPYSSSSNLQLGDSTNAFRYLYLKDDAGVIRRVSINSGGVLTVT